MREILYFISYDYCRGCIDVVYNDSNITGQYFFNINPMGWYSINRVSLEKLLNQFLSDYYNELWC